MPLEELPVSLYNAFSKIGQALSNEHRLRILNILAQSEHSVDEIAARIKQSKANTSVHLKVLYRGELITRRKEGKQVFYDIASTNALRLWLALRDMGLQELPEVQQLMAQYASEPDTLSILENDELLDRAARGEIILLDLRFPHEFAAGHLPNARSIPASELAERLEELPAHQEIIAYCRGPYCVAAIKSVQKMRDQGLPVRRIREGVLEWRAAGKTLSRTTELHP